MTKLGPVIPELQAANYQRDVAHSKMLHTQKCVEDAEAEFVKSCEAYIAACANVREVVQRVAAGDFQNPDEST